MNPTKNIIILVLMLLAFGLTAKAQSTIQQPYEGALHTYTCDGISVGASYDFYITANADGTVPLDDVSTDEFEILNPTGIVEDDGLASTPIQWNTGASSQIYYLWLEASIGGCSNFIQLEITPQVNQFDLLSKNIPVDFTESCPDISTASNINTYTNAGSTVLEFSVTRVNGTDNVSTASADGTYDWTFIPKITVNPDIASLSNYIIKIVSENTGEILPDIDNRYTVSGIDNQVTAFVSIDNAPGDERNVIFEVTEQYETNTNLSDSNALTDTISHTIMVMPVIDGMGGGI